MKTNTALGQLAVLFMTAIAFLRWHDNAAAQPPTPTPEFSSCLPIEADPDFFGNPLLTQEAVVDQRDVLLTYMSEVDYGTVIVNHLVVTNTDYIEIRRPGRPNPLVRRAYPIQALDTATYQRSIANLTTRAYGTLYLLAAVDFGVGGLNLDPVFAANGDFVGVVGDWSVTWDQGCHQEFPGGSWRALSLFDQDAIVTHTSDANRAPDEPEYRISEVRFNMPWQSYGDYREVWAGYLNGEFRVFWIAMCAAEDDRTIGGYRYGTPDIRTWFVEEFGGDLLTSCNG